LNPSQPVFQQLPPLVLSLSILTTAPPSSNTQFGGFPSLTHPKKERLDWLLNGHDRKGGRAAGRTPGSRRESLKCSDLQVI
jgi:hypothetical protein